MKTIAFDVMNNDSGLKGPIAAALSFCKEKLDYYIILVGDRSKIIQHTKETEKIKIMDVPNIVNSNWSILESTRHKTSMSETINLLVNNKVDAIISSGPTKHYIGLCTLMLGKIPGISRPAFMSIIPTIIPGQKFLLLDIGANIQVKSHNLVEWAKIGSVFSEQILHIVKPRVALHNIGSEKDKGFDYHIEANKILSRQRKINYIGFLEARHLLYGECDVVVTDGYAGNIILKTLEGAILALFQLLKSTFKKNIRRKMASLALLPYISEIKELLDYRNVGAAWVLGANGLAIKAHSSSDKKAYIGALNQIYNALETNAFEKIKGTFK